MYIEKRMPDTGLHCFDHVQKVISLFSSPHIMISDESPNTTYFAGPARLALVCL